VENGHVPVAPFSWSYRKEASFRTPIFYSFNSRTDPLQFDCGDEVLFNFADQASEGGKCVVGITPVETEEQAVSFGCPKGTVPL
jgi:hypothetical protein